MREPGDLRTKWIVAAALVAAGYAWAWWETPVEPMGEESVVEPFLITLTMTLPPGLTIAALSARFASRKRGWAAATWLAVVLYGIWTSGWTALMAIWSGRLMYCGDPGFPPCFTDWPPRLVALATAATSLSAAVLLERWLQRRWGSASAPS